MASAEPPEEELGLRLQYYRYRALGGVLRKAVHVDSNTLGRANQGSDGSFAWIRQANLEPDRAARRGIAGETSESIEARGYILEGKSVLLRHVSSSHAGTRLVSPSCGHWPTAGSWLADVQGEPKAPAFEQKTVLDAAEEYCKRGYRVAAVNAASAYHAGGGFLTGGRHALEESMCIQSTLFPSLQRGEVLAQEAGVSTPSFVAARRDGSPWMPHLPADGVLLSPQVEVFRRGTNDGYPFMDKPYQLQAVVSVAMPNCNPSMSDSPVDAPSDPVEYAEALKARWRAVLVAAKEANANCLVVPDAGCGVFKNDPKAVGSALGETLRLFGNAFDEVVIASPAPAGRICHEAVAKALDPNPEVLLPEPTSPSGPSWLFETGRGFTPFYEDCQVVLEQKYQQFKKGGPIQVWISSAGRNIKVDFQQMTQVVEGSTRARAVLCLPRPCCCCGSSLAEELWALAVEEGLNAPDETTALLKASQRSQCLPSFLVCEFTANLERHFGWKLLFLLWTSQHLLKGFTLSLLSKATPYFFRHFQVAAPQVQIFSGVVSLPWAMKPVVGLTSDVAPIFGYHKAPYILGASVCSSFAFAVLSFWTASGISVGVVCLVLVHLQLSTADLLTEARYAVKMQKVPEHGPDLMTYVWAGINMASLVAMLVSGPLIHEYGWRVAFFCTSIPAALVVVPIALGCLEEVPVSREDLAAIRQHYLEHRETCFLCLIMLFSTFTIMIVGLVQHDPRINFAVSLATALFTLLCFSLCLTPVIAKANAFAVLYTGLSASVSGAAFYFYTDTPEMYPAGPHFSDVFYNTVLGTVGIVFSLLGMFLYQRYLQSFRYRMLILVTAVIMFCFSILDVMMFARLNVKLGIPDHWFVLGLSVCEQMVYQWQWMPQVLLTANLCPRGMEATMFALLAGCHNLGTTVSSNFGAALLHLLEVKPRGAPGESAQFDNLWIAAAISSFLPLVTAVCLSHLLPDCRQNEKIDAVADPTHGSLLRRWLS